MMDKHMLPSAVRFMKVRGHEDKDVWYNPRRSMTDSNLRFAPVHEYLPHRQNAMQIITMNVMLS